MEGTAAKVRAAETAAEAAVKVRVVDVKKAKAVLVARAKAALATPSSTL